MSAPETAFPTTETAAPGFLRLWLPRALLLCIGGAALWLLQKLLLGELVPTIGLDPYVQGIVALAGVNVILAVSLNLINGVTGQFSLGHAGFMAVGAYVSAAFTHYVGPRLALIDPLIFLIAILLGALAAGLAGFLVGLPSLRLRGDYLAIVTLGFGQIIVNLIRNIEAVGGASGFNGLDKYTTLLWIFGAVALCILTLRNLIHSNLGRAMRAVRDDEIAAAAAGIDTTRVKVLAFVISAAWAGVAGALQVHYLTLANPRDFEFLKSVEIVVMVVLGGLGSMTGVTIAAVSLRVLENLLLDVSWAFYSMVALILLAAALSFPRHRAAMSRGFSGLVGWIFWPLLCLIATVAVYFTQREWLQANVAPLRFIIYSLILIVMMLLRPQGLLGHNELRWNFWRRANTDDTPKTPLS